MPTSANLQTNSKEGSALQTELQAVQEKTLVIFSSSLAQKGVTCAVEITPVSVIAPVTEFNM